MIKRRVFLITAIVCILFPLLLFLTCAFFLPVQYEETFLGELKYKCRLLKETPGKRIIILGGSSMAFAIDSNLLRENFPDYEVVNFGMYAALGTKMMLDLSKAYLHQGDIVIVAPEQNEQTLSGYFDGYYAWQGLDGAFSLLPDISLSDYGSLLGNLPYFASEKLTYFLSGTTPSPSGIYKKSSFNRYGDVESDLAASNTMPLLYDPNMSVSFSGEIVSDDFISCLRQYQALAGKQGCTLFYHLCPVNRLAVLDDTQPEEFYAFLQKKLDIPVLGDPRDAVMDEGWFFDTNFHLNQSGRTYFTRQLIRDLKAYYGISSKTAIPIPRMPAAERSTELSKDQIIDSSVYAGRTDIQSITIPDTIRLIEDYAFQGCTALSEIHIQCATPSELMVGQHLLDGTQAKIYVPAEALSDFRTDYRFSQYANDIFPENNRREK